MVLSPRISRCISCTSWFFWQVKFKNWKWIIFPRARLPKQFPTFWSLTFLMSILMYITPKYVISNFSHTEKWLAIHSQIEHCFKKLTISIWKLNKPGKLAIWCIVYGLKSEKPPKKGTLEKNFPRFMHYSTKTFLVYRGFRLSRFFLSPENPRWARTSCRWKIVRIKESPIKCLNGAIHTLFHLMTSRQKIDHFQGPTNQ